MTYSTEKRNSTTTDVIYTGKLGYPRLIGNIFRIEPNEFSASGGCYELGKYRSHIAAKYSVIASFERLGGRLGETCENCEKDYSYDL